MSMARDSVSPADAAPFFAQACDWEADRLSRIERSERRAWFVAGNRRAGFRRGVQAIREHGSFQHSQSKPVVRQTSRVAAKQVLGRFGGDGSCLRAARF